MFDESFEIFAAKHGEYVEVGSGVKLFVDGAIATAGDGDRLPSFRELPRDPQEALRLRRRYAEAKRRTEAEDYPAFARRHGGDPVLVDDRFLFADGATCDRTSVLRAEPPVGLQLLQVRRQYCEAKLRAEDRAYNEAANQYAETAACAVQFPSSCPPLPREAVECLSAGRQRIADLREQLAKIDGEIAESLPAKQRREADERRAAEMRERMEIQNAVRAVVSGDPSPPSTRTPPAETMTDVLTSFKPAPPTSDLFPAAGRNTR